jgi:DNA gyrase subunit A
MGDVGEFDIEDLIAEEDVVVTLTHAGYIKRMPLTTYRRQGRGGQGIIGSDAKEGDFIEELFIASTHDYMLVFLNDGRMHWLKVYDIPSLPRTSKGRAIVNLLQMEREDRICAVLPVRDFDDRYLVTATKLGQIKKTELKAYANPRRGGIQATGLHDGDVMIGVALTRGTDEVVLATKNGQAIRFPEGLVRPMGRTAAGVRAIRLRKNDEVVDMVVVDEMATLLTVCENGYGKRTRFDEYRVQGRGGSGIINIKATKRNGCVVAMKAMRDADELMLITLQGKIVRMGLADMRIIGRATQGVRVIGLREGDKLVSVARVVSDDNTQGELDMSIGGEGEDDAKLFRSQATSIGDEEEVQEQAEEEIVDEEDLDEEAEDEGEDEDDLVDDEEDLEEDKELDDEEDLDEEQELEEEE